MTRKPAKKSPTKKKGAAAPHSEIEQAKRQLKELMESEDLITPDDLKALFFSLAGPSRMDTLDDPESVAKDEAQQLAFDAMEAESEAEARKLAKRALRLDPDCVDALVLITDLDARSTRETIEGLQKAVAAGERSLGAQFIRENTGHFWMLIETRPYMRVMAQLAGLLRAEGLNLDAIKLYQKMLALNPNDNQGVRDPLLGLYLAFRSLDEAGKLLHTYKEDASANFAWGRVLERFLCGDLPGAATALKKARKTNRFVELYFSGKKSLPKEMPQIYSPGSEEEAVLVLDNMSFAWAEHKEALLWLMVQLMPGKVEKIASVVPGKRLQ